MFFFTTQAKSSKALEDFRDCHTYWANLNRIGFFSISRESAQFDKGADSNGGKTFTFKLRTLSNGFIILMDRG